MGRETIELQSAVVVIERLAGVCPLLAIEGVGNRVAGEQLAVEHRHRVRKATPRSFLGKYDGRLPLLVAVLSEDALRFRTAADVELSLVTGDAIQRAVVAGLAAVFPLRAAQVAINSARIVAAVSDARPIDRPSDGIQIAVVNNQRADALRFAVAHLSAIGPLLPAVVAIDVPPVFFVFSARGGGVQLALVDGHRLADIVARRAWPAAILPVAHLSVVDAKINVTVGALRLKAAGSWS